MSHATTVTTTVTSTTTTTSVLPPTISTTTAATSQAQQLEAALKAYYDPRVSAAVKNELGTVDCCPLALVHTPLALSLAVWHYHQNPRSKPSSDHQRHGVSRSSLCGPGSLLHPPTRTRPPPRTLTDSCTLLHTHTHTQLQSTPSVLCRHRV